MSLQKGHFPLQEVGQTLPGHGTRPFAQTLIGVRQAVEQLEVFPVQPPATVPCLQNLASFRTRGRGNNFQMQHAGPIQVCFQAGAFQGPTHG